MFSSSDLSDPVPSASDAESADAPAAPPAEAKRQRRAVHLAAWV